MPEVDQTFGAACSARTLPEPEPYEPVEGRGAARRLWGPRTTSLMASRWHGAGPPHACLTWVFFFIYPAVWQTGARGQPAR